jgi:3-dehydroquinate synthase
MANAARRGGDAEDDPVFWQRFSISFAYPVVFTRGLFDPANASLADALALNGAVGPGRCAVFLDDGLLAAQPSLAHEIEAYAAARPDAITLAAAPIPVPGGEKAKADLGTFQTVLDAIQRLRIDRHSYVLAVGGGAMLDTVGLAAATAHRGVRLLRAPTTTLAQNDAGVGVKTAVNLNGAKNYMGAFAPPWAVLNDFDMLRTLPPTDRIAGVSEAVKVALIRDAAFFSWLEGAADALRAFEPTAEEHMIRRCAALHLAQIAHGGDPFETGSARPLDFGHWAAHRLESITGGAARHGDAVAIGVALDARYATLAGLLTPGEDARVATLLRRLGFRLWRPELAVRDPAGRPALLRGVEDFREHLGGRLSVTMLRAIGEGVEVDVIDEALVAQALSWLETLDGAG